MDPETARRAIIGAHWATGFNRQRTDQPTDLDTSAAKLTKAFLGGIRDPISST